MQKTGLPVARKYTKVMVFGCRRYKGNSISNGLLVHNNTAGHFISVGKIATLIDRPVLTHC